MTFVVSDGAMQGLQRTSAPATQRLQLADDYSADYTELWRTQPQLRTVISFLARNVSQLALHSFERISDTDRKRLTDHPLAALIAKPNPRTTRYRLFDALMHDLGIQDRAYWAKLKGPGLLRLPPKMVTPKGDSWAWADEFEVKGSKGKMTLPADRVVEFHGFNPDDPRIGCSPIESLRRVLAEEWESGRMREQVLRNGARASGYLTRPTEAPPWTDGARERFRSQWRGQYTGGGGEAGGTPILEDGMTFVSASQTAEQLQYVAARKLTREEVAAAYFIPPPMVGILDNATFSNITEQHKMLYQDTLGPWLTMIQEEIALQLVPDFDDTGKVYVEFNLAEKLKGSFEEQAAQLQTSVGAPWLTRNEARARANLPQIEGGDELVTPLNVLVGGQASPRDSAPPKAAPQSKAAAVFVKAITEAQSDQIQKVLARFFDRQAAAVLSAIGSGGDWWDSARWDKELRDDLAKVTHTLAGILGAVEAERLGYPDGYDADQTVNFLLAVAADRASGINATTKEQLDAAEPGGEAAVFDTAKNDRARTAAESVGTFVAGFAAVEAAKQIAAAQGIKPTKTWRTGSNPRASHARMDGQTVDVGEPFSNGMEFPGQSSDPDESAGCNCSITINL